MILLHMEYINWHDFKFDLPYLKNPHEQHGLTKRTPDVWSMENPLCREYEDDHTYGK